MMSSMVTGSRWVVPSKFREAGIRRVMLTMVAFAHCLLSLQVSAQLGGSFPWQSELYTDHELIGRIWDSRRGQFVTDAELWDTLGQGREDKGQMTSSGMADDRSARGINAIQPFEMTPCAKGVRNGLLPDALIPGAPTTVFDVPHDQPSFGQGFSHRCHE